MGSPSPSAANIRIVAGKLFDPFERALIPNQLITVSRASGRILFVESWDAQLLAARGLDFRSASDIDLRAQTVLPGFVDTHVHFFLHPYSEMPWEDQLTRESVTERTVRATVHARRTLLAGFTAVRDLGTEGAGDADIALRKCLSGPDALIPGPRYFCANRAIAATGSYGPRSALYVNQEGVDGVTGAEVADGPEGLAKAVRRQIGAGADWIKIYADYRYRARVAHVSPRVGAASIQTFNHNELKSAIETAHKLGVKVAAHATNAATVLDLLTLGVNTIEHGYDIHQPGHEPDALALLAQSSTTWVPTLAAYYTSSGGSGGAWERGVTTFRAALALGMDNIACGGDTGVFAHGNNALELQLMERLGAQWAQVLRWATLGGWECIRGCEWEGEAGMARLAKIEEADGLGDNEVPFGALRAGWAADIIATTGDLETDFQRAVKAESISFVMKASRISGS